MPEGRPATRDADGGERFDNCLDPGPSDQQERQQQPSLRSVQDAAVDQATVQQIGF
jgi:hypothetical protein